MSRPAVLFLVIFTPILAILLALLGVMTIPENTLGWFLLLTGLIYSLGLIVIYWKRRERFWEPEIDGEKTGEELGDRSFWLIAAAMMAAFYFSPLEYIYFAGSLPRGSFLQYTGLSLILLGAALFVWALRTLGSSFSGHVSVKRGQELVRSGPYKHIRHPTYTGYLLMALGISLGYSSLAGLASVLLFLVPSVVYRLQVEEKLLASRFGEKYLDYKIKTKKLIPGLW
ncbi:MAG: isoprenylcysteine carboxylmethyltransferase family protein [Anaerolineales bacterium]